MTLIKDLQIEHEKILSILSSIEEDINKRNDNEKSILAISEKLHTIKDLIEHHFKVEEEKLYPIIMDKQRNDGIVDKYTNENQELIEDFWNNQKITGKKFIDYINKYSNPDNILSNYDEFFFISSAIIHEVRARIDVEEKQLFPLFLSNKYLF